MADYVGQVDQYPSPDFGLVLFAQAFSVPSAPDTFTYEVVPEIVTSIGFEATGDSLVESRIVTEFEGALSDGASTFWFEMFHLDPTALTLNNILGLSENEVEVYNAYRETDHDLDSVTNNAGEGVTLTGLPSLPDTIAAQNGLVFQVDVSLEGPSVLDGTIDFVLGALELSLPLTGIRVFVVAMEPETPVLEQLQWKTNIMEALDGTEQRQAQRVYPRQLVEMLFKAEVGSDWRNFRNALLGFHPATFGMPVWWEARLLTQAVTSGDTTFYVDTACGDFRAGGSVILWVSPSSYDALTIESMTTTSITLSSPVSQDYNVVGTLIMPLRVAILDPNLPINRHQMNLDEITLQFLVTDGKSDLADISAYDTHNSKVLLHDPNAMESTTPEGMYCRMVRLDNKLTPPVQYTDWPISRGVMAKGWACQSMADVWQIRQLVHALRGSQVTFYLPSFYEDLVPQALGSSTLDIDHVGYASFIQNEEPWTSIWIELTDGTVLTREVTGYVVVDANTERLTVGSGWPGGLTVGDINRISFLRLSRIANDRVTFTHSQAGRARVGANIVAVQG